MLYAVKNQPVGFYSGTLTQEEELDGQKEPEAGSEFHSLTVQLATCFTPTTTSRHIVVAPKDKTPKEKKCGVIYHIPCQGKNNKGPCQETDTEERGDTRALPKTFLGEGMVASAVQWRFCVRVSKFN
ncbi:hypothetical protein Bbelb_434110 [Branchiostoma belcheri]|nr:hypothetical protein Bbelb_434110 [Branchiostoma belcheri]